MTTYNGEKYVLEQLNSLKNQTILPNELVIVDDCSTDKTLDILNNFKSTAPFDVHIYTKNKNIGKSDKFGFVKNFEEAISHCKYDIVFLADQDDVWFKNKLEKHIEKYILTPSIMMIANNAIRTNENLQHQQLTQLDYCKLAWNCYSVRIGCCFSFRRDYLNSLLPIIENCSHDVWLSDCSFFLDSRYDIDKPLQYFRRTPNSWSVINENSDSVTISMCYITKYKRIFLYFLRRTGNIKLLNEVLARYSEIYNRFDKFIVFLALNGYSILQLKNNKQKLLEVINLLQARLKICYKKSIRTRLKLAYTLLKKNKNYCLRMAIKDIFLQ